MRTVKNPADIWYVKGLRHIGNQREKVKGKDCIIGLRLQLVPDVGLDAAGKVIGKLMHIGGDLMSQRLHGE